jgi:Xaa-Pro aminopeptidase
MATNLSMNDMTIEHRKSEINTKLQRVFDLLDCEGLNGLALTKHSNFSWMTAGGKSIVTICVDAGVSTLLITKKGCFAIMNNIEFERMREEEKLEELGFEILSMEWYENKTAEIIESIVGDMSKVGSDMFIPGTVQISKKFDPLRYSLIENEIIRYRYLGDTLSAELEKYIVSLKPGMTENEIAGGLSKALWQYDIDPVLFLVAADERAYIHRHAIPTDKKLKKHLCISVNGRYKGLITTVTRMVHFGKEDSKLKKQYEDTCEIECKTIASINIGEDDIAAFYVNRDSYEALGYSNMWAKHGQGGSQGYNNRDYMITPSSHRVTVVNQCYCFNPVIDGTKTEDAFVITDNGPLFITRPITFPKLYKDINGVKVERPDIVFID